MFKNKELHKEIKIIELRLKSIKSRKKYYKMLEKVLKDNLKGDKGFWYNRHIIYREISDVTIFMENRKIVGFYLLNISFPYKKVSISMINSYKRGFGRKMVNYIIEKYHPKRKIIASNVVREAVGFWKKMNFHQMYKKKGKNIVCYLWNYVWNSNNYIYKK